MFIVDNNYTTKTPTETNFLSAPDKVESLAGPATQTKLLFFSSIEKINNLEMFNLRAFFFYLTIIFMYD